MRNNFLFRIPGQHGMYDFDEIRTMNVRKNASIGVVEITKQNHSRNVGNMSIAAILSKFG